MKNIIVGTAGHVDHGKSCLIRALSGVDPDRLQEEKRRGITIDLGFASLPDTPGLHIGIVDVPGHEKFVKNMLAGIGGLDLVLLVVALDEGVMPQTTEHFEILNMLHISRGILVLTKKDLVDEEWADLVEEDVRNLVKGSFLEQAPAIRVSAQTGENIQELHDLIVRMVADAKTRREEPELFRLPIDRVFSMEGFGTVVTGTLQEGSVEVGQEIMVYPQERLIRLRGIQSHGQSETAAQAGQRTALNLLNVKKEELKRGDVLASPGSIVTSRMIDVKIELFDTGKRKLKSGDRVHFNYGAAQTIAKVVLMDRDSLEHGESAYGQLRFDEPVALKRKDRFIIRFLSPVETFGGGVVLDVSPGKHKRKDEAAIQAMSLKEQGTLQEILELGIREKSGRFLTADRFAVWMNLTGRENGGLMETLKKQKRILILSDGSVIHKDFWKKIVDYVNQILKDYHEKNRVYAGMDKEEVKSRLCETFRLQDKKTGAVLLEELEKRGVVKIQESFVSVRDHSAGVSDEVRKMYETIGQIYETAGIEAPPTADVLQQFQDKNAARQVIADLHKTGQLIKISSTVYMDRKAYDRTLETISDFIREQGGISLGEFRDMFHTTRKYSMQYLEFLDGKRITKLDGDRRVLPCYNVTNFGVSLSQTKDIK